MEAIRGDGDTQTLPAVIENFLKRGQNTHLTSASTTKSNFHYLIIHIDGFTTQSLSCTGTGTGPGPMKRQSMGTGTGTA